DTVSIRLGNGNSTFTAASDVTVGSNPISLAVGDFNGDGKQDFATANYDGGTVSICLGNGQGAFTTEPDVPVGAHPNSVAVPDFNGDGKPDLAVANDNDKNSVSVLLNTFTNSAQIIATVFRRNGVSRVRIRDAATGAVRGVLTPFKGFRGRLRLQLLDVNGDGS